MKKDKTEHSKDHKQSRRKFLKTAAVAGAAAGSIGFPSVMRLSAAETITIKMQTAWDAGTLGFTKFKQFCDNVGEITEGKLVVEGFRGHRGHL